MLTLLECMKNNLPSNDSSKFKTTESHMDWEKVAFKDFSGDMCKLKWVEISNEVTDAYFLTHKYTSIYALKKNQKDGKVKQTCYIGQTMFTCLSVSSDLCLMGQSGLGNSNSPAFTILLQSF